MARATARHILVSSEAKCNELKTAIEGGADFAEVAREHSSCPPVATAATWARSAPARWSASSTRWSSARR